MDDPIKQLLASTGLTCDELLRKLQDYKSLATPISKDEASNPDKTEEAVSSHDSSDEEVIKTDPPTSDSLADVDSTSDDIDGVTVSEQDQDAPCVKSITVTVEGENLESLCDKCDRTPCDCQMSTNVPSCSSRVDRKCDLTSSVLPKDVNKLFDECAEDSHEDEDFAISETDSNKPSSPKSVHRDIGSCKVNEKNQNEDFQAEKPPITNKCHKDRAVIVSPQQDKATEVQDQATSNCGDSSRSVACKPEQILEDGRQTLPIKLGEQTYSNNEIRTRKSSQADEICCNEISSTEEDDMKTSACVKHSIDTNDEGNTEQTIEMDKTVATDAPQQPEGNDCVQMDEDVVSSSITDGDNPNGKTDSAIAVVDEATHISSNKSTENHQDIKLDITAPSEFKTINTEIRDSETSKNETKGCGDKNDDVNLSNKTICTENTSSSDCIEDKDFSNNVTNEDLNQKEGVVSIEAGSNDKDNMTETNDDEAMYIGSESSGSCEIIEDSCDNTEKIDIIHEDDKDDENNCVDLQDRFMPSTSNNSSDTEDTSVLNFSGVLNESINGCKESEGMEQNIASENCYEYVNDSDIFDDDDDVFNEDEEEDFSNLSSNNVKNVVGSQNTTGSNFVDVSEDVLSINNDSSRNSRDHSDDPLSIGDGSEKNKTRREISEDPLCLSTDSCKFYRGQEDPLTVGSDIESKDTNQEASQVQLPVNGEASKPYDEPTEDPLPSKITYEKGFNHDEQCQGTSEPIKKQAQVNEISPPSINSGDLIVTDNASTEKSTKNSISREAASENEDSSNLETFSESENVSNDLKEDSDNEQEHVESLEDDQIRDILKLQLSSLRNRKKNENFKIDSKDVLNKVVRLNPKKQLASDKVAETLNKTEETEDTEILIQMSNETDLVISAVVGGCDENQSDCEPLPTSNTDPIEKINAETEEQIKLTKTTDITKIKGWKNKRFCREPQALSNDNTSNNPVEEVRKIISKNKEEVKTDRSFSQAKKVSAEFKKTESEKSNVPHKKPPVSTANVNKTSNSDNISPFVSNILDDFLNLDSSLQISYDIPKLDAEEGLVTTEDPLPLTVMATEMKDDKTQINTSMTKAIPEIKAKTLAEKRRILERINKQQQKKRKLDKSTKVRSNEEIRNEPVANKKLCKGLYNEKYGYILYNNKKIWLPTRSGDPFIAEVYDPNILAGNKQSLPRKNAASDIYRRPSLLNQLQKTPETVKYKAGPLSKKFNLCNEEFRNSGETCIKKLPQVYLDVVPEFTKKVPDEIHHLFPNFGWGVNEVRTEFALTALMDKKKPNQEQVVPKHFFRVPVKYANDQKFVLARKKINKQEEKVCPKEEIKQVVLEKRTGCLEDEIRTIVNDLLNYIETKEIEDCIIKNDEPITYDECSVKTGSRKPREVNENISTIVRKDPKKRKIDLELLRLNCKVVNVTLEESNENNCLKQYCQMGCVCQSLRCESVLTTHCRKLACMFECTCPKQKSVNYDAEVVLPAGTDLFSSDAVLKIDDRAKQNLARVEREFTQTIIYANDKTIVVSASGRDKLRRATKTPKKYTDYFEENDSDEKSSSKKAPDQPTDPKLKAQCHIPLQKLNLDRVIPFCLSHEQYDCFCKCRCSFGPVRSQIKEKERETLTVTQKSSPTKLNASKKPPVHTTVAESPSSEPDERKCARIKEVFANYKTRNKQPEYTKLLQKFVTSTTTEKGLLNVDTDGEVSKKTGAEALKEAIQKQKLKEKEKRKSELSLGSKEKAMQRRKKMSKSILAAHHDGKWIPPASTLQMQALHSKPIFDGELILPVATNGAFLNVLSISHVPEGFIRILPWINVLNGYKEGTVRVFRHRIEPHQFLAAAAGGPGDAPPRNYVSLEDMAGGLVPGLPEPDFARWIREGAFPVQRTFLYTVLVPSGPHFRIVGVCLNSFEQKNTSMVIVLLNEGDGAGGGRGHAAKLREAEELMLSRSGGGGSGAGGPAGSDQLGPFQAVGEAVISSNVGNNRQSLYRYIDGKVTKDLQALEKYIHRDIDGVKHTLGLIQHDAKNMEPVDLEPYKEMDEVEAFKDEIPPYLIKAHLPTCRGRWRMIYMRSDFTYLVFEKSNYSIKYTDLKSLQRLALGLTKTFSLHSKQLSEGHAAENFGIYACHLSANRIFVGPYGPDECHGLSTLRYMRRSLVSTELFNKMQGKLGNRIGVWLRRLSDPVIKSLLNEKTPNDSEDLLTIDLTSDEAAEAFSAAGASSGLKTVIQLPKESAPTKTIILQAKASLPPKSLLQPSQTPQTIEVPMAKKTSGPEIADQQPGPATVHPKFRSILKRPPPQSEDVAAKKAKTSEPPFLILPSTVMYTFNRYVLSNIPHLGYIGAYLNVKGELMIAWIFHNKVLKFDSVIQALQFLEQRLCMLLQPVPLDFKIKFILMKSIDLKVHKPIDSKYLNGHYICGEFGVYDVRTLTQEVLDSIGVSRDEVVNGLTMRVQNIILQRMKELSSVLYDSSGQLDYDTVLTDAKKEILKLDKQSQILTIEKSILETSKNEKVQILHKILDDLPQDRRIIEYNKFKCYTKYSSGKVSDVKEDNTDAIEILDSTDISYASKSDGDVECPSTETPPKDEERAESPDVEEIVQEQECIEILDSDDDSGPLVLSSASPSPKGKREMPKLTEVFGKKIKLKPLPENYNLSILKPNLSQSPKKPAVSAPLLTGLKCVKTKGGKFVLVKSPTPKKQELGGTRILIKNNKVYTISPASRP